MMKSEEERLARFGSPNSGGTARSLVGPAMLNSVPNNGRRE